MLLDEPTNDLDVSTLGALEAMLVEYPGSAIIVSHDRWFLDRVATSILAFEGDGRVELHSGNYSEYRARTLERRRSDRAHRAHREDSADSRASARAEQPRGTVGDRPAARPRKLGYKERRELEGLLDVIDAAESEAVSIETRLADPASYKRDGQSGEIAALKASLETAQARVAKLTDRWEELEGRREATE